MSEDQHLGGRRRARPSHWVRWATGCAGAALGLPPAEIFPVVAAGCRGAVQRPARDLELAAPFPEVSYVETVAEALRDADAVTVLTGGGG